MMFGTTKMDGKENKSTRSILAEGDGAIIRDEILINEMHEGHGPKGVPQVDPIMQVRDLHVSFATEAGICHAVRGVNFDLWRGRTLGIVGEPGSGTSVTALSLIGLLYDNAMVTGSMIMNGEELIGKTLMAIVNLPPRKMMGLESNGMLISAVHTERGEERLNLLMLDDKIPAGAKMC